MQKTTFHFSLVNTQSAWPVAAFLAAFFFFGAARASSPPLFQTPMPDAWVLDKTVDNVEFYHRIASCNGKKAVLLKFVNRNSGAVNVSWKEVLKTQLEAKRETAAGVKRLRIPPGETAASGCDDTRNKALLVLPAQAVPVYAADVQDFAYSDIRVTKEG